MPRIMHDTQRCWQHFSLTLDGFRDAELYSPSMRPVPMASDGDHVPTVEEMRAKVRDETKSEKQAFFERRFKARQLLFGKALGQTKNLNQKDKKFVLSVEHETYALYLQEFVTGRSRYGVGKSWSRARRRKFATQPMSFIRWRQKWYGSQKVRYRRFDIPLQMKKRMEDLKHGTVQSGTAPVRELH
jgi:hypothetical protein